MNSLNTKTAPLQPIPDYELLPQPAQIEDPLSQLALDYQLLLASSPASPALSGLTTQLLTTLEDQIRRIAYVTTRHRFGSSGISAHFEDVLSEAYAITLEAIKTYDSTKGISVESWVITSLSRSLAHAVDASVRATTSPASWQRMARIAADATRSLTQTLHRKPTRFELVAELEQRCYTWAGGHTKEAESRLRRSGMLGALANLDQVLGSDTTPLSLDAPTSVEDEDATLADFVRSDDDLEQNALAGLSSPAVLALATGYLSAKERTQIIDFLSGTSDTEFSLRPHAKTMAARLYAPHAQYAYLTASIETAFDPLLAIPQKRASRSADERLKAASVRD